ncbi:MAG: hypothetical protein JNL82_01165 [Myxococcales bacterium]|nr:hypothetical protein [Myxococcales bacterium]
MLPPLELADCAPHERDRIAFAAACLRVAAIRSPDDPAFRRAWDLLAAEFLERGELEDAAVLADFLRVGVLEYAPHQSGTYHLLAAWHGDELVGVRDCYVDIDLRRGVALVSLAHCLVVPAWRRRGLAPLLRTLPLALGRAVVRARVGRELPTLVVAEMEPADPAEPATLVRLIAYGRSGFRALDPRRVPYAQPELRQGASGHGIPMLGIARAIGIPTAEGPVPVVPAAIAEAFPILFHATHRRFVDSARVDACEANALAALRASDDPVALLPLPVALDDSPRILPLSRAAVLPLYPRTITHDSSAPIRPTRC